MKVTIIDPPSGWRYGFPKPIPEDQLGRAREWLVENGYPQSEIDALGDHFYYRFWEQDRDEVPRPPPQQPTRHQAHFDAIRGAGGAALLAVLAADAATRIIGGAGGMPAPVAMAIVLAVGAGTYWHLWLWNRRS